MDRTDRTAAARLECEGAGVARHDDASTDCRDGVLDEPHATIDKEILLV